MVELAVAITLATLIVAGLYQLFIMQSRQLQFLDMQTEMNQNLRFAADVVTRSVREAGLGTGEAVLGVMGNTSDADSLSPVLGSNAALGDGTDVITVVHQDPSLTIDTSAMFTYPGDTTVLTFDRSMPGYEDRIGQFVAGDLLLCSNFANPLGIESYMWQIASIDLGDPSYADIHLQSNGAYTDFTNAVTAGENLPSVIACSRGEVVTFYVDSDDSDGLGPGSEDHPVLMMDLDNHWPDEDDVPLVDDIEDLQFAYCNADLDGMSPCTAAGAFHDTLATTDWPWMVQVSILARSRREDPAGLFESTRPALRDHAAAGAADHHYRQLLVTEVALRNMRFYNNLFE